MSTRSRTASVRLAAGLACVLYLAPRAAFPIPGEPGQPGAPGESLSVVTWLAPPPGIYRESLTGDFDCDGLRDVVHARAGKIEVMLGPSLFGAVLTSATAIHDLDVLPGEDGYPDSIVTVGDGGAIRHTWDGAAGSWDTATLSTDTSWKGAVAVVVRPGPGGVGPPSILGAMNDSLQVRALTWNAATKTYDDDWIAQSDAPVQELVAFDQEGDGVSECGALCQDRLHVVGVVDTDPEGKDVWDAVASYYVSGFASIGIARGSQDEELGGAEWLAWMVTAPNGWQFLSIVHEGGATPPVRVQDDPGVVGFCTGDWNGDRKSDVALSWIATREVCVLENLGGDLPVFDMLDPDAVTILPVSATPGSGAPLNQAEPAVRDTDNDGDGDLVFALQDEDKIVVLHNPLVDEATMRPGIPGDVASTAFSAFAVGLQAAPGGDEKLLIHVSHPGPPPGSANHLEVILFEMPLPGGFASPSTPLDPQAVDRVLQKLVLPGGDPAATPEDNLVGFDLDEDHPLDSLYFWLQRYVDFDESTGRVLRVYPSRVYGIHGKGDPSDPRQPGGRVLLPAPRGMEWSDGPTVRRDPHRQHRPPDLEHPGRRTAVAVPPEHPVRRPPTVVGHATRGPSRRGRR